MPFYGISIGLVNSFVGNMNWGQEVIYFSAFFFFLLIIPILHINIRISYIFNITTLIIVVLTIGIYIAMIFLPNSAKLLFQYLVTETGTAAMGYRNYGVVRVMMVWYRTSPLLVFPLTFFLHQVLLEKNRSFILLKTIAITSIVFTLLLSGTRANMLTVCLILFIYINIFLFKNNKKLFVTFNSFALILGIYVLSDVLFILFNKSEHSNLIKYGHFISYLDLFTQNPLNLIWGQGIGLPFYTAGFHKEVFATELQYFEMVRIWGLPLTIVFMGILVLPLIKDLKAKKITHISIGYLAFLFIAGTNPFLLDSTGMIVLVYVFSSWFKEVLAMNQEDNPQEHDLPD